MVQALKAVAYALYAVAGVLALAAPSPHFTPFLATACGVVIVATGCLWLAHRPLSGRRRPE